MTIKKMTRNEIRYAQWLRAEREKKIAKEITNIITVLSIIIAFILYFNLPVLP